MPGMHGTVLLDPLALERLTMLVQPWLQYHRTQVAAFYVPPFAPHGPIEIYALSARVRYDRDLSTELAKLAEQLEAKGWPVMFTQVTARTEARMRRSFHVERAAIIRAPE